MAISNDALNQYKDQWNNMSYEQQQSLLKSNSKLWWALQSLWVSVKANPAGPTYTSQGSVSWGGKNTFNQFWGGSNWDYTKWPINVGGTTSNNNTFNQFWGGKNWDYTKWPINISAQNSAASSWVNNQWSSTAVWWQTNVIDYWNSLSYEQQMANKDRMAKDIQRYGLKFKTPTSKSTTNWTVPEGDANLSNATPVNTAKTPKNWATGTRWTTQATPKQQEWDYQDNSQERMYQIADNLDKYYQTNPALFEDYSAFYNFFIRDKWRSQDQIDFLNNYFWNGKEYARYSLMSPEQVWDWIVNWTIPQTYLDQVSKKDPQRAELIKAVIKDAQDAIANEANLATIAASAWLDKWWFRPWNIKEMRYVDKDNNGLDDRLDHPMWYEEKTLNDEIAKYNWEYLRNHIEQRDQIESVIDQYPEIDYTTALLIAWDRNKKLQKEADSIAIALTQLNWRVSYLQAERERQDKAGQNTIAELQKNYWLYMEYSPEWIAERTEAQYAAEHPTLAQADNWTDAQKSMALNDVLDWYYEKFWDIIERSQWQVVNDVIAYAKKHWVSLAQALKENFITPLRDKPQFNDLATWWTKDSVQWTKIGEDDEGHAIYWFVDTSNKTVSPYWTTGTLWITWEVWDWRQPSVIKDIVGSTWTDNLWEVVSNIYDTFDGKNYDECGYLANDYYKAVTWATNNLITWTWKDRAWLFTETVARPWDIIWFDWTNSPTASDKAKLYGHVGLVESTDSTGIRIVDANWKWDGIVRKHHIDYDSDTYKNYVAGFYHIPEADRLKVWWRWVENYYIDTPDARRVYEEVTKLGSKWLDTTAKQNRMKALAKELNLSSESELQRQADAYYSYKDWQDAQKLIDRIDDLLSVPLPDRDMRDKFGTKRSPASWSRKEDWTLETAEYFEWRGAYDEDERAEYNDWMTKFDNLMANLMFEEYETVKAKWASFWSMTEWEWWALKDAAQPLTSNMSEYEYRKVLNNIKAAAQVFVNNAKSVKTNKTSGSQQQSTEQSLLNKYNSF